MTPSSVQKEDRQWMELAIEESRHSIAENTTKPHPKVGAVVVRDGKLLGKAYRNEFLRDGQSGHAEFTVLELKLAEEIIAGATVYTTLEPCTRRGPGKIGCAQRLISRKVKRVVIGMLDPDTQIRGTGQMLLRDANVTVDNFDPDLADIVQDLNHAFSDYKKGLPTAAFADKQQQEFTEKNRTRSLDDWYLTLNVIYWNRNFHRDVNSIFTHLMEMTGGLSLLASEKKKPNMLADEFVPKALAWWMSLCGKVRIRSVADMLWSKFPGVCPYCLKSPHDNDICTKNRKKGDGPDWQRLRELSITNEKRRPKSIAQWQELFASIYRIEQSETFEKNFARFAEEMGELAEAIRALPASPGYFLGEAADVFAWLMHIQSLIDFRDGSQRGEKLERAFCRSYPDRCLDCESEICRCPPILAATIGRIAHQVPTENFADPFLSAEATFELFQRSRSKDAWAE